MNNKDALLYLLFMPASSEGYVQALKVIDVKNLNKVEPSILSTLLGKIITLEIAGAELKNLPNIFHKDLHITNLKRILKALQKITETHVIPKMIVDSLSKILIQQLIMPSFPLAILLCISNVILIAHYGVNGERLDKERRLKIKEVIRSFLSTAQENLEGIPETLHASFKFLKLCLHHKDQSIRMQARDICEKMGVPLALGLMISLSVDGITKKDQKEIDEVVLIVGPTGVGKSTFVNALYGNQLRCGSQYGRRYLELDPTVECKEYAEIGHSARSKTLYPQLLRDVVDCPGFNGTRDDEEGVCDSLGIPLVLKNVKKVKAILILIEYDSFEPSKGNRGAVFRELTSILAKLIDLPKLKMEYAKTGKKIPIKFVITKPPIPDRDLPNNTFNPDSLRKRILNLTKKLLETNKKKNPEKADHKTQVENLKKLETKLTSLKASKKILETFPLAKLKESIPQQGFLNALTMDPFLHQFKYVTEFLNEQKREWPKTGIIDDDVNELFYKIGEIARLPEEKQKKELADICLGVDKKMHFFEFNIQESRRCLEESQSEQSILEAILEDAKPFIFRGYNIDKRDLPPEQKDQPDDLEKIRQFLRDEKTSIPRELFLFDATNPAYIKVMEWARSSVHELNRLLKSIVQLPEEIDYLNQSIKKQEQQKHNDHKQLHQLVKSAKEKLDVQLKLMLAQKQQKIDAVNDEIKRLNDAKIRLQTEIKSIETAEPIDYGSCVIKEERQWNTKSWGGQLMGVLSGDYTQREIKFPYHCPIQRVELSCVTNKEEKLVFKSDPKKSSPPDDLKSDITEKEFVFTVGNDKWSSDQTVLFTYVMGDLTATGTFTLAEKNDLKKGKFGVTYQSHYNQRGLAAVRFFVFPKDIPVNKNRLDELNKRLEKVTTMLQTESSTLSLLNSDAKDSVNHFKYIAAQPEMTKLLLQLESLVGKLGYTREKFKSEFRFLDFLLKWDQIGLSLDFSHDNLISVLNKQLMTQQKELIMLREKYAFEAIRFKALNEIFSLFNMSDDSYIELNKLRQQIDSKAASPPKNITPASQTQMRTYHFAQGVQIPGPTPNTALDHSVQQRLH